MPEASLQLIRHLDAADLTEATARRLLQRLWDLQQDDRVVQLCLTGGRIATAVYARLGELLAASEVDPSRLELWWGDDYFLPTEDPRRNAGPTLALLARYFHLNPSRTHPMPSADGTIDTEASAALYAKELGDTVFDICLLGIGVDGHVASVFPGDDQALLATQTVIGVSDAPTPPAERISLSLGTLSRSTEVWFLVSGTEKAKALSQVVNQNPNTPASLVHGTSRTLCLADQDAASALPYHACAG